MIARMTLKFNWIVSAVDMDIYAKARENMVECQLKPDGVSDSKILDSYMTTPREMFVPDSKKDIAYIDEDLIFDGRHFILSPSTHGLMVQALNIQEDEAVLDVGCCTGYSSAILSNLAKTVVATSNSRQAVETAKKNCEALDLYNVVFYYEENIEDCFPEYAPYTAIILNGAVTEVPQSLLNNLADGGRAVYIERAVNAPMGRAILLQKLQNGEYSKLPLFDTATPYLIGYEPEEEFSF